jgi:hypothetical protein
MALEQKKSVITLEGTVFYICLFLLALAIGMFFYLQFLTNENKVKLDNLTIKALEVKTEEQKKLENDILTVDQQLRDFLVILDEHKIVTNFFRGLEAAVHPDVYFSGCDLDVMQFSANFSGHAKSFDALGQQMLMLENATGMFETIKLERAAINEKGGVDFGLSIKGNPQAISFSKMLN